MSSSPKMAGADRARVLAEIAALPDSWHTAGTLGAAELDALARHIGPDPVPHSIETGTGKSTLLLSHLSRHHTVFTLAGDQDTSYAAVVGSPLLNRGNVEFVLGPTQLTVPAQRFEHRVQVALLDGPHAYPFPDLEYYHTYPHLDEGALLVLDDIHIPTLSNLFAFLREDAMFQLVEIVGTTAFFRRTSAPTFPPTGDDWPKQTYNWNRFPVSGWPAWGGLRPRLRSLMPVGARRRLKGAIPHRLRRWLIS